ncbi:class I SAM-dependent methyltransferase [Xenorhabdus bovienii]|uniref:class I SAM-dependent methyltransferase n=1 Tax=Xenorhabdus bovienii TaxID=40576 RepID=UPI0023B21B6A|nr:class I SAM-dependent methyltransferase [Xenorhabdus bovienii]MDE9553485.1 class I SAM-dependent methyltransferase [Xenorhabdus bovienii]
MNKPILDMCCGSRMFYFDKSNPDVLFCDIRSESHLLCDGRKLNIDPDVIADFRDLPFESGSFNLVIFDPPHLVRAGENGWQRKKYGALDSATWRDDLTQGFKEAFRVLRPERTLIFKWNETQIKTSEILALTDIKPVVGHPSGKRGYTHWMTFYKKQRHDQ